MFICISKETIQNNFSLSAETILHIHLDQLYHFIFSFLIAIVLIVYYSHFLLDDIY